MASRVSSFWREGLKSAGGFYGIGKTQSRRAAEHQKGGERRAPQAHDNEAAEADADRAGEAGRESRET